MKKMLFYTLFTLIVVSLAAYGQAASQIKSTHSAGNPAIQTPDTKQSNSDKITSPQNAVTTEKPTENSKIINVPLVKVVDGDTIKVNYNGKTEEVRFLLIDTPETHHPSKPVQPFGPEAETYVKQLFTGQMTVDLELGEGRDKYDRLLAYVYLHTCPAVADLKKLCETEGKSVAKMELANGLARVAYVYEPNTKYLDDYRKIEVNAKHQKVGIWSIDGYVQNDGYHPEVKKVQANEASKPVDQLKPTSTPPSSSIVYYQNCTAVKAAGKAPLYRGDPGYRAGLDRDNDGIACE
jgi:micrococcal nuclease